MLHHGLDLEGYAEGMASLAHWPDDRGAVLRRLAVSEERWEGAAAGFRAALEAEAGSGQSALTARFQAAFEQARARLARERADLAVLAPLHVHAPAAPAGSALAAAPHAGTMIAPAAEASETRKFVTPFRKGGAAGQPMAAPGPSSSTVEMKAPAPFVPAALPFEPVSDEELEAYAQLTADLELHASRRAQVLARHEIEDDAALARERARWQARFDKDVRLKMHWDGLHRSFVGFVERQRARGKDPAP